MAATQSVARIFFGQEFISLGPDGTWEASSERARPLARIADSLSRSPYYEYRPSHGCYGPLLANRVARMLGGQVRLGSPPRGAPPPDVVF
jgi:hypothetical protein